MTLSMGEKNCKWNSWQRISLQNIKAALAAHYKEKQTPNKKKMNQISKHISPKKTYRWQTNTWKDAQHCSLLEKCKSKLQWGITSYWSEWPSFKKSTNNTCWRWYEEKGTLLYCWWECKFIQLSQRPVWRFL